MDDVNKMSNDQTSSPACGNTLAAVLHALLRYHLPKKKADSCCYSKLGWKQSTVGASQLNKKNNPEKGKRRGNTER